jgi:ABC-type nitrate/sulfonate/bicarbonate transport system permease component
MSSVAAAEGSIDAKVQPASASSNAGEVGDVGARPSDPNPDTAAIAGADAISAVLVPPRARGRSAGPRRVRALRSAGSLVLSLAVVLGVWELFLVVFHVSSFIGRDPLQVWRYLVTSSGAGAARSSIASESVVTLRDAALGLVAGTLAALGCATAITLWRAAAHVILPVAMLLRSMPLVAMTPLIVGMFGRNLRAITVIAGIVTFFPTFVNVGNAMRSANRVALEVCHAYGATAIRTMQKVQLPSALPALFTSLRIAAPLALIGALLAEWLATGKGLGYSLLTTAASSDYDGMWARVVVVTLYSLVLYLAIGAIERRVLTRFGDHA